MALVETGGPPYASSTTNTVTSASFTPSAGELLVAIVSNGNRNAVAATGCAVTDTGSRTWYQLVRIAGAATAPWSDVSVWVADAGASPSSMTVTATISPATLLDTGLAVRRFSGAAAAASQNGQVTSLNANTAWTIITSPSVTGSQVVGAAGYAVSAVTLTANGSTSIYGQATDSDTIVAFEAASQSTAAASGVTTLGFTNSAPAFKTAIVTAEIIPAAAPSSPFRLFPSTNGPANAISNAGNFIAGVMFEIKKGAVGWLQGYWYWVANGSPASPTAAQKFALWQLYSSGNAVLISSATVTSGTLSAGWNYVPLATPVPLSIGGHSASLTGSGLYVAQTGVNGNFVETNGSSGPSTSWGTAGWNDGVNNGPLTGLSDEGGTQPGIQVIAGGGGPPQGAFTVATSDAAGAVVGTGDNSGNFWVDISVSLTAPSGYAGSYRLWPNLPNTGKIADNDTGQQTMGTVFTLSQACTLNNVWFYSPSGAIDLPASTQIWSMATQSLVAGTNLSASWSGAATSGWVANSYSGHNITLPAGNYVATIYYGGGNKFYGESNGYFGTLSSIAGPGSFAGITNGPLSAPSNQAAVALDGVGNSRYFTGGVSPTYPNTYDTGDGGENRWVDVEVTPLTGSLPVPFLTSQAVKRAASY